MSTVVATIPTLMVHGYADEQRNRDLHYDTFAHKFCSFVLPRNGSALYEVHV